MRLNHPVTQNEYLLAPDAVLLSTTDTQSHIQYANQAFIEVSGYTREELAGQPHNLVRHPDTPKEAFADMWATLKAGQSWSALVKNRRKNGDFYWVRANATPVRRDGRVAGYMSVRTTPSRAEVAEAERVYALFRAGKAHGLAFRRGMVVRTGWRAALSLGQTLGLRARLRALTAAHAVALLAVGHLAGLASPAGGLAVLSLAALLAFLLERQFARPLDRVLAQAQAVAAGQPGPLQGLNRIDEVGLLLRAVNQAGLNLRSLLSDVGAQARGVAQASSEIAAGNRDLGGRVEQAAGNLQESAAALEEISATVSQTADAAQQAQARSTTAREVASQGSQAVAQVAATMADIHEASCQIGDITGLIDSIAFQTNLLALNASIEAARAGAHGRGFAVVAAEVRTLARRSGDAAQEIKALIDQSATRVARGTAMVQGAARTMEAIRDEVQGLSGAMAQIRTAAAEQAQGLSEVTRAVAQLDEMGQQNAVLVEQGTGAAQALQERGQRLAEAIGVFSAGTGRKKP